MSQGRVGISELRERLGDRPVEFEVRPTATHRVHEARYGAAGAASVEAFLVEPQGDVSAAALVVHPVSGDRRSMLADAQELADHGVRCLLPHLLPERTDGTRFLVESRMAWIETLCHGLAVLREDQRDDLAIGYLGQNLGGSLAGAVSAVDRRLVAAVAAAPLMDIGQFFASADHPVARDRRAALGVEAAQAVRDATADLELAATIGVAPGTSWLVQLGGQDDWLDADTAAADLRLWAPEAEVVIYPEEGHDLSSASARSARVDWLRGQLCGALA